MQLQQQGFRCVTPNSPNGCQWTVATNAAEVETTKEKSSEVRVRSLRSYQMLEQDP